MCSVTFSSHRNLTQSPHLTQKGEKIRLQLLSFLFVVTEHGNGVCHLCQGRLQRLSAVCWRVQVPLSEVTGTGLSCAQITHTLLSLAMLKGEAVASALLPIQTTLIGPSNLSKSK